MPLFTVERAGKQDGLATRQRFSVGFMDVKTFSRSESILIKFDCWKPLFIFAL